MISMLMIIIANWSDYMLISVHLHDVILRFCEYKYLFVNLENTYQSSFHLNKIHLGVILNEILGNRAARNTLLRPFKRSSWIDLSSRIQTHF